MRRVGKTQGEADEEMVSELEEAASLPEGKEVDYLYAEGMACLYTRRTQQDPAYESPPHSVIILNDSHKFLLLEEHMLTFEEKLEIMESFPELRRKDVSLGRVNFHYEESVHDKTTVVYHLHPNGNGFVYAELIENKNYLTDHKGMVNIRDFTEQQIRSIIKESIESLSESTFEEIWVNHEKQELRLVYDFDLWNIYADDMLDGTFPTYNGAANYLEQEGFARK